MYADINEVEGLLPYFPHYARVIGESEEGRKIYAFIKGEGGILVHGGVHAREHITTRVAVNLLKRGILDVAPSIAIIPLVNPDGVELCLRGANGFSQKEKLLQINGSEDFSLWKANAKAVDLNVNFDADFGQGKYNLRYPSSANYIGEYPECAAESRALADFARAKRYECTFSLHAKGEVIYYGFKDFLPDGALTEQISKATGYSAQTSVGSAGGFKDWYSDVFRAPSYTIELGKDFRTYLELYLDENDLTDRVYSAIAVAKEWIWKKNTI